MAPVTIKHAQFLYYTESEYTDPKTGEQKTRLSRHIAMRGQTVDIPRDEDQERGETTGAFMTTADAIPADEVAEDEATSEPPLESSELDFSNQDELVAYLKDNKPTVVATVALADNDPEKAEALMDAEEIASGGQPRAGVMNGLQKILDAEE
jgi:hypothetical protein